MSGEDLEELCERLEHWETDPWAARAVLKKELLTQFVVDPCAGTGILGLAAMREGYGVISGDIHDWGFPLEFRSDWLAVTQSKIRFITPDLAFSVFMNPPFTRAAEFVEHALALGARKVVCFQRYAWYESEDRRDFWDKNPPNRIWICGSRATCWRHDIPKCERKNGTRTAHAWFVWEKGHPPGPLVGRIYKADAA